MASLWLGGADVVIHSFTQHLWTSTWEWSLRRDDKGQAEGPSYQASPGLPDPDADPPSCTVRVGDSVRFLPDNSAAEVTVLSGQPAGAAGETDPAGRRLTWSRLSRSKLGNKRVWEAEKRSYQHPIGCQTGCGGRRWSWGAMTTSVRLLCSIRATSFFFSRGQCTGWKRTTGCNGDAAEQAML